MSQDKILIIKLGALGDFIQSLGPSQAIRSHHTNAHITLLTTNAFKNFAEDSGYFDEIWLDEKPKWFNPLGWLELKQKLNSGHFARIYDLQNNDRTCFYFRLLKHPKPEWVGIAKGASHRNISPERTSGHAFDGHVQTLSLAGIKNVQVNDLSFINADIAHFDLKDPYVLLVPGCAPSRPEKRWPAQLYGEVAKSLAERNIQPVLIGTKDDQDATDEISAFCPDVLNLNSQTSLSQIIALGRSASGTIGNDTGPMHMIAPTGCPCLVLFSNASNPVRHRPLGPNVQVIQKDPIDDISPAEVLGKFSALMRTSEKNYLSASC